MTKSTRRQATDAKPLFSLDVKEDFIRETFCTGGNGAAENGVRMIHKESGGVGEGRMRLDQRRNERIALQNLVKTEAFQGWQKAEILRYYTDDLARKEDIEARVEELVEEYLEDGEIRMKLN